MRKLRYSLTPYGQELVRKYRPRAYACMFRFLRNRFIPDRWRDEIESAANHGLIHGVAVWNPDRAANVATAIKVYVECHIRETMRKLNRRLQPVALLNDVVEIKDRETPAAVEQAATAAFNRLDGLDRLVIENCVLNELAQSKYAVAEGITRQAITERKIRAVKRLKQYFYEELKNGDLHRIA